MENLRVTFELEKREWEEFVQNHPSGNIFQTPAMFNLYNSIPNHQAFLIAVVDDKKGIQAIMSCCFIEEPGVKRFFSRRSIVFGGPLVKDNDANIANFLLRNYNQVAKNRVIYTQFRNLFIMEDLNEPLLNNDFKYEDHLTVLVNLAQSRESLVNNINKKRLSNIRASIKKGVKTVKLEDQQDIHDAIRLIKLTYRRIKLPSPPEELFLNAKDILGDRIQFFGSVYNDALIGVRVCLNYKNLTYDWYAGSDLQFSRLRPNDLLPMECILWAKDQNNRCYDFGGAGKPDKPYGVRDFKLQYGGELANFGRYTKVHQNIMYKIGELGIRMIKRQARPVAN
jgi:serine/alanine adding enzyme